MMKHINKCIFFGVVHDDAELGAVGEVSFRVSCTHRYRVGSEWKMQTESVPCVWRGPQAKATAGAILKGQNVFVEGQFSTRTGSIRVASVTLVGPQVDEGDQGAEGEDE